jgi:hypothetical protein
MANMETTTESCVDELIIWSEIDQQRATVFEEMILSSRNIIAEVNNNLASLQLRINNLIAQIEEEKNEISSQNAGNPVRSSKKRSFGEIE